MNKLIIPIRGFTLIELLIVIAIIGILASIVLASLSTARNKGTDAAIQSEVNNFRAQAEIYGSRPNGSVNYIGLCSNANITKLTTDMEAKNGAGTGVTCGAATSSWAVSSLLIGSSSATAKICVDSVGTSKIFGTTVSAGATVCP